jgi:hypothetical protein
VQHLYPPNFLPRVKRTRYYCTFDYPAKQNVPNSHLKEALGGLVVPPCCGDVECRESSGILVADGGTAAHEDRNGVGVPLESRPEDPRGGRETSGGENFPEISAKSDI